MVLVTDRALLLKRFPYGESSLVAHLCTREHGRAHLIAKGAYRPGSRYFAVLDHLDTLEIVWAPSRTRDLSNLHAGSIPRRRRRISADPRRYFAAMSMLELADLASRPEQSDPDLFDLLEGALDGLEEGRAPADLELVAFELRFLQNLGLGPALHTCAACAGPADPVGHDGSRVAFSAGAGGRLCRACADEARASGRRVGTLPLEVLEAARALLEGGTAAGAAFSQERVDRVRDFAGRFLDYHLETRPRTHRSFLSAPNRNAPSAAAEAV